MKPTVLIADDHKMFLEGLRGLLSADYEIVGEAEDGDTLISMARELEPDVIVTDLSMPGTSGLGALRELVAGGVGARFVIVTMHTEPEYAAEALKAGASGYVLKASAGAELLTAIGEVLGGGIYLPPKLAPDVLEILRHPRQSAELTQRQCAILKLLVEGLVAKEIGDRLGISPRTVEYHKYNLLKKLGLRTTAELIQFAVKEQIVTED